MTGVWTHEDPRGLAKAFGEAALRARAENWTFETLEERTADLRAIMAATGWLGARLAGKTSIVRKSGERVVAFIDASGNLAFADEEHRAAFARLAETTRILAQSVKTRRAPPETFATVGGLSRAAAETGLLPVLAVFGIGLAAGTAFAFVVEYAADIVDRELARHSDERKLVANHVQVLQLVDKHVAREERAGKPLPLDPATVTALGQLGEAQARLTQPGAPPRDAPSGGSPLAWALAAAAALYALS
jgi:hypothetical protein